MLPGMGSFNVALLEALLSAGVSHDRARAVVDLFDKSVDERYGLHAQGPERDAIAATVIGGARLSGGVGYVMGTLTGVLMLGVIQTLIMFDGSLGSWWTRIAIGACSAFCSG